MTATAHRHATFATIVLGLTLAACSATTTAASTVDTHEAASDYEWAAADEVAITLADGASTGGPGVTVDGDTITITAAGTYRLSGTLRDGQVVVDSADEGVVRLVLDGVSITSSTTSALAALDAGKLVLILADGSDNTLADAATYVYPNADVDEPNAALYSAADLSIAGDGALTVRGAFNDAIASKDGLVIAGGTIAVTAADDGIRGKDDLVVRGGTITVDAGGDALKADNADDASLGVIVIDGGRFDLTAGEDAVDAVSSLVVNGGSLAIAAGDDALHADVRLEIHGGTIDVSRSYEGIEATQIVLTGGDIDIVSEDDGLNVAGGNDGSAQQGPGGFGGPGGGGPGGETAVDGYVVEMSGGTLVIDAGGDGFDSNGDATVTGGTIVVNGPTANNNGALDVNGELLVSDAVLLAAGSAGMAEAPDAASAQAYVNLQFNATQAAGTVVTIRSSDGAAVATFVASKPFQSLVLSAPGLVSGASYEVVVGGTVTGESTGGLYLGLDASGGTSVGSVTAVAG
ncbi:MAG: carbohydrate-binding domain-containing protein [Chloroflexota bacterium]